MRIGTTRLAALSLGGLLSAVTVLAVGATGARGGPVGVSHGDLAVTGASRGPVSTAAPAPQIDAAANQATPAGDIPLPVLGGGERAHRREPDLPSDPGRS